MRKFFVLLIAGTLALTAVGCHHHHHHHHNNQPVITRPAPPRPIQQPTRPLPPPRPGKPAPVIVVPQPHR